MITAPILCLAAAIYFEARSEPVAGQFAVAEVVMNRVDHPRHPNTVCAVVREDRGPKPHDCQFSFMCDGKPERIREWDAFYRALDIAERVIEERTSFTDGAIYYHTTAVSPSWSRNLPVSAEIGDHVFFKEE